MSVMHALMSSSPASPLREYSFADELLDAIPEATAITHEGRILQVNTEFVRLFGFTAAECVGADLDELVIPDGRLHENELILHALRQGRRASIETVRRARNGEAVEVAVLVSRLQLGGDALGMYVTYRDLRKVRQQEARLQFTALHDGLTGLANRALFADRLSLTLARMRRRPDRGFAVVFLDLDGFKAVNDTLGHAAGDRLLLEIARRLEVCLRPQDTVARFGGDEFALLLDETGDPGEVGRMAERIQASVRQTVTLDGAEARVSASIGIAMGSIGYVGPDEILRDADQAMYRAKSGGKARYVVHERALGA